MLSQKESHIPTTFQLLRWRSVATSFETRVFSSRNIRMTRWSRDAKWCYSESKRPLLHVLYKRSNDFYWFDLVELSNIFLPWLWFDTIWYIHIDVYIYIYTQLYHINIWNVLWKVTLLSIPHRRLRTFDRNWLSNQVLILTFTIVSPKRLVNYICIIWLIMICIIQV